MPGPGVGKHPAAPLDSLLSAIPPLPCPDRAPRTPRPGSPHSGQGPAPFAAPHVGTATPAAPSPALSLGLPQSAPPSPPFPPVPSCSVAWDGWWHHPDGGRIIAHPPIYPPFAWPQHAAL